ncbi:VQ motif-containing protein 9-like [Phoenix dactylifera]|uniref:VQ motif-containing protein 9-like n=1 Tax=Phoenix dactylifera TaxID=42345 RepID=A0A8B9AI37_PHODC|nr:VQ motif-containing protein 9-like [Phoenix dactylifera]
MMEKSCHFFASTTAAAAASASTNTITNTNSSSSAAISSSFTTTTTTTTSSPIQSSLKSVNKASYKISKPIPKSSHPNPNPNSLRPSPPPSAINSGGTPPQQPQSAVYNIDKNDFRDVVQKLTGSPAHQHPRPAAAAAAARPPPPAATSRLHRIRPPPLADLPPRSPPLAPAPPAAADVWMRPSLSPLPPFPAVSAASESPISAYMRRLHGGGGGQPPLAPSPSAAAVLLPPPTSPLVFGCLPSPGTAFQMMISSGMVFPTSPGVPLPSPRWGDP